MLILGVPGLVIALAFTYFTEHYLAGFLYQTPVLLVVTYAVMFFPLPDAPKIAVNDPSGTSRSTPDRTDGPPNALVTPVIDKLFTRPPLCPVPAPVPGRPPNGRANGRTSGRARSSERPRSA